MSSSDGGVNVAKEKKKLKNRGRSLKMRSCWVFHYDGSGCDGCNAEYLACLGPAWNIERLGMRNTGNPAYADILLVTGLIDEQNRQELIEVYEQMHEDCQVVAVGACACTGGLFSECSGICPGVDSVIPVDLYVAGCATRPEAIIDALLLARRPQSVIEEPATAEETAAAEENK